MRKFLLPLALVLCSLTGCTCSVVHHHHAPPVRYIAVPVPVDNPRPFAIGPVPPPPPAVPAR